MTLTQRYKMFSLPTVIQSIKEPRNVAGFCSRLHRFLPPGNRRESRHLRFLGKLPSSLSPILKPTPDFKTWFCAQVFNYMYAILGIIMLVTTVICNIHVIKGLLRMQRKWAYESFISAHFSSLNPRWIKLPVVAGNIKQYTCWNNTLVYWRVFIACVTGCFAQCVERFYLPQVNAALTLLSCIVPTIFE